MQKGGKWILWLHRFYCPKLKWSMLRQWWMLNFICFYRHFKRNGPPGGTQKKFSGVCAGPLTKSLTQFKELTKNSIPYLRLFKTSLIISSLSFRPMLNQVRQLLKKHTWFKTRVQNPDPIWYQNGQNGYPISYQNVKETIPVGAAHTYISQ